MPCPTDKIKRRQIHEAVRECLPQFDSTTRDDKIVVMFSGKRNKKYKSKAETQVTFTLHKKFVDTQTAISRISKFWNKRPNDFFVAGNKDKRGITTQLVFCRKLSVYHAMRIRLGKSWPDNIDISNFKENAQQLRIGDLYGNHFKLALRIFNSEGISDADLETSSLQLTEGSRTSLRRALSTISACSASVTTKTRGLTMWAGPSSNKTMKEPSGSS